MANFIAMFSSLLLLLTQVLAKDLLFDICAEVVTNAQYRCYRQAYDDFFKCGCSGVRKVLSHFLSKTFEMLKMLI